MAPTGKGASTPAETPAPEGKEATTYSGNTSNSKPKRHPTRKAIIRYLEVRTANITSAGTLTTALRADFFNDADIILVQEHHLHVPIFLDNWRHTLNKIRMD